MSTSNEMHIQMQDYLFSIQNQVEEGELSNLDGLIVMRENKEALEKSLEIIKEFENSRIDNIATEAADYPKGYKGYLITQTSGRKTFDFKSIPQFKEIESTRKTLEEKFKGAFDGFQKGVVQTTEEDGVRYWIDENSELQPFPEVNFGKSFLTIHKTK